MGTKTDATLGNGANLLALAVKEKLDKKAFDDLDQTGTLSDLFKAAIAGSLKTVNREEFRKTLGLPPLVSPVLEMVREFDCPATEAFELLDFFNTSNKVVKFAWIDGDMVKYFPNGHIPAEGPRKLVVSKLTRNAKEKEFRATGAEKTTWADLKWMLEQQPNGEKGDLHANGWANLFFVGSCLVCVRWGGGGWSVGVRPVGGSSEWSGGRRRFSRN